MLIASGFSLAFAAASAFLPRLSFPERFLASVPVGLVASAWVSFLCAIAFGGISIFSAAVSAALVLAAALLIAWRKKLSFGRMFAGAGRELLGHKHLMLLLALAGVLFSLFFSTHVLEPRPDGLYSAGSTWADLAFHLTLVNSFIHGANSAVSFPPVDALYAGGRLFYPFLPDFSTAALAAASGGGLDAIRFATIVPGVLLALSLVGLLYFFAYRFSSSRRVAAIAVVLVFLAGGLGFARLPSEAAASGHSLLSFDSNLPADYVHATAVDADFYWLSLTNDLLLPQKSSLYAFPLAVLCFLLLWTGLGQASRGERRRYFLAAGVVAGLLPFVQAHAFIAVALVAGFAFLLFVEFAGKNLVSHLRDWLYLAAPAALLGLPQLLYFAGQSSKWGFARLAPVWGGVSPAGVAGFWLKNLGVFLLLALAGFFLLDDRQKRFYACCLVLFAVASVFIFQPWPVDNTKLLYEWVFAAAPVAAIVLEKLLRRKDALSVSCFAALFLCATASGGLALLHESQFHYQMYSQEDLQLAQWVGANTPAGAVFLTSDYHLHPVPSLAGRSVVMGYRGWLWTHGIDYAPREKDVREMFSGSARETALLKKYGVGYAVIGESELRDFNASEAFFDGHFQKVFVSQHYSVYATSAPS